MKTAEDITALLDDRFGVLADSTVSKLIIASKTMDIALGDLFLIACRAQPGRLYLFRANRYATLRDDESYTKAHKRLVLADSYVSEDLVDAVQIEIHGRMWG